MASAWPSGDAQSGINPRFMTKLGALLLRARFRATADNSNAAGQTPLIIQGNPSQTNDLLDIYDSSRNLLFFVDKNGNVSSGGAAGNKVVYGVAETDLTAANILGMNATPLSVVPAPPAGTAIIVEQIVVVLNLTATQFASGGVVHFNYHGQSTELMAQTIAAATVNGGAGQSIFILEPVQTAGGSVVTKEVGVDITNATGAFTTGTGTAKVFVSYQIVTL